MSKICRWGFLSTAGIAKKNWHAIACCDNATLVAVASRIQQSAEQFVEECQSEIAFETRPQAIAGYDELLARDDIDAVYVPLPTGLRKEWVIKAANCGKHVLCEKPCAINRHDLQEMVEACKKNNVQFMDGVMLMHTERILSIRPKIQALGELKRIHSQLSFGADEEFLASNIRTDGALEPHGCLGDLGWYNIRISLIVSDWQMPHSVRAVALNETRRDGSDVSVPLSLSAELYFANQLTAGFFCSFETHHQQWAIINGTEGMLKMNDFVLPFSGRDLQLEYHQPDFVIENCQFNMFENKQVLTTQESGNNAIDSQEKKLFQRFSEIVNSAKLEQQWAEYSIKTQTVVDACLESAQSGGTVVKIDQL